MKPWRAWVAVFLGGLILGTGLMRAAQWLWVDPLVEKQRSELSRLTAVLRVREGELFQAQARLDEEGRRVQAETARALAEADAVLGGQGAALTRLKAVLEVLRRLQKDLQDPRPPAVRPSS